MIVVQNATQGRRLLRRKLTPAPLPPLVVTQIVNVMQIVSGIEVNLLVNVTEADPLADVSEADPAKWTARYDGTQYVGIAISAVAYNELFILFESVEDDAGASVLNYAADPSDIASVSGRLLAGFEMELG